MRAEDLLTVGVLDAYLKALYTRLDLLLAAPAAPAGADLVFYSAQKLAAVLDVHPDTIRNWLSKGKVGKSGQVVKLQAFRFTTEPRIPWPAVLAYHRGEDFDLNSLPAPLLTPPAELEPAPIPKLTQTPDVPAVLRVA